MCWEGWLLGVGAHGSAPLRCMGERDWHSQPPSLSFRAPQASRNPNGVGEPRPPYPQPPQPVIPSAAGVEESQRCGGTTSRVPQPPRSDARNEREGGPVVGGTMAPDGWDSSTPAALGMTIRGAAVADARLPGPVGIPRLALGMTVLVGLCWVEWLLGVGAHGCAPLRLA